MKRLPTTLAALGVMAVATACGPAQAPWPTVKSVDWSPDSGQIVSGGYDGMVRLVDVATGESSVVYRTRTPFINTVEWSPDGQHLLAVTDQTVELFDVRGREIAVVVANPPLQHEQFPVMDGRIFAAFSPAGDRFVVAGWNDGRLMIFDARSGRAERVFSDVGATVSSVAWLPDGRKLAVGSWDRIVRLLDVGSGTEAGRFEVQTDGGHVEVAASPDGQRLASYGRDADPWVLDLMEKKQRRILVGNGTRAIAWSPDGERIAVLCEEALHLWGIEAGRVERSLPVVGVDQVVWSPDGRYVAAFGSVGVATIWNSGTGERKTVRTRGTLAFSPDMRFVALGEAMEPFVGF